MTMGIRGKIAYGFLNISTIYMLILCRRIQIPDSRPDQDFSKEVPVPYLDSYIFN